MFMRIMDYILSRILKLDNYGDKLEAYIASNQPKTSGDVERLERQFAEQISRGFVV